ncbi:DUF1990 family protein [Kitasatospora purpeofusca]|uniref:DUF1990 family protein n=1 Tax=Kitasatospora purpeofusca TaxID=67352 RepID=UPI0022539C14|nr:DUF1990 domain-containing protein [Kitasatospora purpeofusca]MCX4756761.1 DUF1990 domain-containing protein [Kitasatospora purpeofusca]WSR35455.1 DUF1990 domain-containing protein [Kitasatospora purpeofusca]
MPDSPGHEVPRAVPSVPSPVPSVPSARAGSALERRLNAARATEPDYREVGATADGRLPEGYKHLRRRVHLGHGPEVMARAGRFVLGWGCQLGTGFAVFPYAPAEPGATVLLRLRLPGSRWPRLVIPCRVVWTVDEPDRIGFAYGTLPGHPECGEEAFLVSMDAAGEVWFEVVAFARLTAWYARLGRPVAVLCQYLAIERYLASVLRAAADPDPDPGSDPDPRTPRPDGAPPPGAPAA